MVSTDDRPFTDDVRNSALAVLESLTDEQRVYAAESALIAAAAGSWAAKVVAAEVVLPFVPGVWELLET
jgi:hypothetical protein